MQFSKIDIFSAMIGIMDKTTIHDLLPNSI